MSLPGPSIPLRNAALCADCLVVFDMADSRCPKCGGEAGWMAVESNRAARALREQRNTLDEAEGVLLTIGKRRLGPNSTLALRMVDRIRASRNEKPAAATAGNTEREVPVP